MEAGVTILVCLGFLPILGKLRLFTGLLTLLLAISRSSALRHSASPYLFLLLPSLDIVYPFYVVKNFFKENLIELHSQIRTIVQILFFL